jgi:hypothetical protein
MNKIIEQCEELLDRFERAPIGQRWHTPDRKDFTDLIKIVKKLAELQSPEVGLDD